MHVKANGDLDKAVESSEFEYEVEGRIIRARKRAARKIIKWWKMKRTEGKEKKLTGNYFELASPAALQQAKKADSLGDIRLIRTLRNRRDRLVDLDILQTTEYAKDELLSFCLTNIVSSSLDFHFILMSLNKIE